MPYYNNKGELLASLLWLLWLGFWLVWLIILTALASFACQFIVNRRNPYLVIFLFPAFRAVLDSRARMTNRSLFGERITGICVNKGVQHGLWLGIFQNVMLRQGIVKICQLRPFSITVKRYPAVKI